MYNGMSKSFWAFHPCSSESNFSPSGFPFDQQDCRSRKFASTGLYLIDDGILVGTHKSTSAISSRRDQMSSVATITLHLVRQLLKFERFDIARLSLIRFHILRQDFGFRIVQNSSDHFLKAISWH